MNRNPAIPETNDLLDQMLRGYFHAQLPQVWPTAPVEVEIVRTATPVRLSNARLTLAASVALLLGLGSLFSYTPQTSNPTDAPTMLGGATADGKKLEKHIFPEHQPKLPGTHP